MGKLRRNLENTHGIATASHQNTLDLKNQLANLDSKMDAVLAQVQKATFKSVMEGPDLSEFFPVENNEQLELFMNREHPQWEARKNEFYHYLYTISSNIKKGFARGLVKALFSRQYIRTVKWPSAG